MLQNMQCANMCEAVCQEIMRGMGRITTFASVEGLPHCQSITE